MKFNFKAIIWFVLFLISWNYAYSQPENNVYSNELNVKFLEAASNGDYPVVVDCLKQGVNVNTQTWEGVSALMYASASGNKQLVRLLLEKGAKVNIRPNNGLTALITASQYGHTEIVEMLLADSAEVNITDNDNAAALHYASLYNNDTIVYMLLQAGANPNLLTNDKSSPLSLASINGGFESAYLLVNAGANINCADKLGFTPLMLASQGGNAQVVELLLDNEATVNVQNNRGFSALSLAILNKHKDIVDLLLQNGADANEINSISLNARSLAKISGDTAIIKSLKKASAKPNYFPAFKTMGAGMDLNFSSGDFLSGFFITQRDSKFNLYYNLGFSFRPKAIDVEHVIPEYGYYQFMERRYLINFDLTKGFEKSLKDNSSIGVNIGGRLLYTFGKYKGTEIPINGGFYVAPTAWVFYRKSNFETRLGYHYSNYGEKGLNKSHIMLSLHYNFLNFKTPNINRKLKWID